MDNKNQCPECFCVGGHSFDCSRRGQAEEQNEKSECKTLHLGESNNPTEAAVNLEYAIVEVLNHYMQDGISVATALGVLDCIKMDIALSFYAGRGTLDPRINAVIDARIGGQ